MLCKSEESLNEIRLEAEVGHWGDQGVEKKKHNLNVENYVSFSRHSKDFKPSRPRKESGYMGVFATKAR